jgi:hypothetical protein
MVPPLPSLAGVEGAVGVATEAQLLPDKMPPVVLDKPQQEIMLDKMA